MASLKKHIEQKCKDCSYDPCAQGSWRHQTENCRVFSCALWEVRPITMETMLRNRKEKGATGAGSINLDALVDGLEDDDEPVTVVA